MSSKSQITRFEKLSGADLLGVLAALKALPQRNTDSPTLDVQAYAIALEGIGKGVAQQAVRRILQGALTHAFFPNPVELRRVCEAVVEDAVNRDKRRHRFDWDEDTMTAKERAKIEASRTPEARARVAELYRKFSEEHDAGRKLVDDQADEVFERSNIRWDNCRFIQNTGEPPTEEMRRAQELARGPLPPKEPLRLDPELVAQVPDAPKRAGTFTHIADEAHLPERYEGS